MSRPWPNRPRLGPDDVPTPSPHLQIAELPGKRLLLRHPGGVGVLHGATRKEVETLLAAVDGVRRAGEIAAALDESLGEHRAVTLLRRLAGDALGFRRRRSERVVLLGGGPGVRLLDSSLRDAGFDDVAVIPGGGAPPADAALWAVLLEAVSYAEILKVQKWALEDGVTTLFLTVDGDGLRLGPTVVPGQGACFACAQLAALGFLGGSAREALLAAETLATGELISAERRFGTAARQAAVAEIGRILAPAGEPRLVGRVALHDTGGVRLHSFESRVDCPLCATRESPAPPRGIAARTDWPLVETAERRPAVAMPPDTGEDLVRRVGILGGGTAGYLAALALRARQPGLEVTVIESSALPVIGVGEATTPLLPQFLHVDLGIDVHRLFAAVRPTFKLGVRFLWGAPRQNTDGAFNYPFGPLMTLEALTHDGEIGGSSLRSHLMTAGRLPLYRGEDGTIVPRFDTETAYHLENRRFAAFLRDEARTAGVERVEATIAEARVAEDGDGEIVEELIAEDGRRFAFDLYVDASGFRSRLIEGALGSPFFDFRKSLPTDAAIVGAVPRGADNEAVQPYTLAETMNAGWCWSTPQVEADHRGYVFASSFLSPEAAETEMRRLEPDLGETRLVRFKSGRHAHFWRGNVIALGNAYGFVEPLESTAIHMLVRQIGLLTSAFPLRRGERGLAEIYNREVGETWDYLRFFLALHYKFNRRKGTSFWRACRAEIGLGAHAELLTAFNERGPLAYDRAARRHFSYPDPLWGPAGVDVILLGQGIVPRRLPRPRLSAAAWQRLDRQRRRLTERALPQAEALDLLEREPHWLEGLAAAYREAGAAFPA